MQTWPWQVHDRQHGRSTAGFTDHREVARYLGMQAGLFDWRKPKPWMNVFALPMDLALAALLQ